MLRHEIASMEPGLKSLTKIKTGHTFLDSKYYKDIKYPLFLPIHIPTIRVDEMRVIYFKPPSNSTKLLQITSKPYLP